MTNDFHAALQAFLDNNPDLPEGKESNLSVDDKPKSCARLDIILEKKGRAGKQATIISGFDILDDEIEQIAMHLKKSIGTGGSARGGEILIQGDRRQQVLKLLVSMGLKARII